MREWEKGFNSPFFLLLLPSLVPTGGCQPHDSVSLLVGPSVNPLFLPFFSFSLHPPTLLISLLSKLRHKGGGGCWEQSWKRVLSLFLAVISSRTLWSMAMDDFGRSFVNWEVFFPFFFWLLKLFSVLWVQATNITSLQYQNSHFSLSSSTTALFLQAMIQRAAAQWNSLHHASTLWERLFCFSIFLFRFNLYFLFFYSQLSELL